MIKKILLIGLIIAVLGLIYAVIPKYQIQTVRVDDDYVIITKINTLTGDVDTDYKRYSPFKTGESRKLKFTF